MKRVSRSFRRSVVSALSIALALGPAVSARSAESILGTVETSGGVWVARKGEKWREFQKTRPIVTGDRLRTGEDGYLIADLGSDGVLGMFASTQVSATRSAGGVAVKVEKGKVAFHLGADAGLSVVAADSLIRPDRSTSDVAAHGYVELSKAGDAVIVLEEGAAAVVVEGEIKRLRAGERLLVSAPETEPGGRLVAERSASEEEASKKAAGILRAPEPEASSSAEAAGAAAAEQTAESEEDRKAGAVWTAGGGSTGKIALGALGVVALAVGVGSAGGSGGGDSQGSP